MYEMFMSTRKIKITKSKFWNGSKSDHKIKIQILKPEVSESDHNDHKCSTKEFYEGLVVAVKGQWVDKWPLQDLLPCG